MAESASPEANIHRLRGGVVGVCDHGDSRLRRLRPRNGAGRVVAVLPLTGVAFWRAEQPPGLDLISNRRKRTRTAGRIKAELATIRSLLEDRPMQQPRQASPESEQDQPPFSLASNPPIH
jgi:hypothetical protein